MKTNGAVWGASKEGEFRKGGKTHAEESKRCELRYRDQQALGDLAVVAIVVRREEDNLNLVRKGKLMSRGHFSMSALRRRPSSVRVELLSRMRAVATKVKKRCKIREFCELVLAHD